MRNRREKTGEGEGDQNKEEEVRKRLTERDSTAGALRI